jgi:glycosyltransferase involved in cell wall biosynthesis
VSAPRVSICVPAYARPTELRMAIESVVRQDFDDLEVIVGDDSGDLGGTVEAVGDPRIHYHRNPRRLGMAGNWTAVLDRARGELIGLLMDDDRVMPGYLRKVVSRFDEDHSLDVVFTNHYFDNGSHLEQRRCDLAPGRYEDFLLPYLKHRPVPVSATLMRGRVWQAIRPLPDLETSDVVMHVRAALAGYVFYYLDEPLMAYRSEHPDQLSARERFRLDVVAAWELFEFDDPECERLRRHWLAEALVSRAAMRLKRRRPQEALTDLTRARSLDSAALGVRGQVLRYLARHPSLAPPTLELLRRAGLVARGR